MKTRIFSCIMVFMAVVAVYGREIIGTVVGENDAPLDYVTLCCTKTQPI